MSLSWKLVGVKGGLALATIPCHTYCAAERIPTMSDHALHLVLYVNAQLFIVSRSGGSLLGDLAQM